MLHHHEWKSRSQLWHWYYYGNSNNYLTIPLTLYMYCSIKYYYRCLRQFWMWIFSTLTWLWSCLWLVILVLQRSTFTCWTYFPQTCVIFSDLRMTYQVIFVFFSGIQKLWMTLSRCTQTWISLWLSTKYMEVVIQFWWKCFLTWNYCKSIVWCGFEIAWINLFNLKRIFVSMI